MIHLERELIALGQDALLDAAAAEHAHPQVAVAGRRVELERAARLEDAEPAEVHAVAGRAVGEDAARETQLEVDVLLDLGEPRVVRRRVRHRVDFDRLLAGQVPRRVERVDADVHQRAAAGHRLAEPPLRRVADVEAGVGQDHPRRADLGCPAPS